MVIGVATRNLFCEIAFLTLREPFTLIGASLLLTRMLLLRRGRSGIKPGSPCRKLQCRSADQCAYTIKRIHTPKASSYYRINCNELFAYYRHILHVLWVINLDYVLYSVQEYSIEKKKQPVIFSIY